MMYKSAYKLEKDYGDNGYDLHSNIDKIINPFETVVIPTDTAIEFDQGIYALVVGRSGLSSQGILCHIGLVDSGYRGEIGVSLTNLNKEPYEIHQGERIGQLVFNLETKVALRQSKSINKKTKRGSKGFGSSGK